MEYLHHATFGISVLGVLVIIFGVLCGAVRFLHSEVASARGANVEGERRKLRQVLGYYLLILVGRNSPLGIVYEKITGSSLVFTWQGAVLAAVVETELSLAGPPAGTMPAS